MVDKRGFWHIIPMSECLDYALSCTGSLSGALKHADGLCKEIEEPLHHEEANEQIVIDAIEKIITDYQKLIQCIEDAKLEEENLTDLYNIEADRIKTDISIKMNTEFVEDQLQRSSEMIRLLETRRKLLDSEIFTLSQPLTLAGLERRDLSKLQRYRDTSQLLSGLELDIGHDNKVVVSLPGGRERSTPKIKKALINLTPRQLVLTPTDDLDTNAIKTNLTLLQELDQLRERFAVDWLADERCLTLLPCQNSSAMLIKIKVPADYPGDPPSVKELRAIDASEQRKIQQETLGMKTVTEMVHYITTLLSPIES